MRDVFPRRGRAAAPGHVPWVGGFAEDVPARIHAGLRWHGPSKTAISSMPRESSPIFLVYGLYFE